MISAEAMDRVALMPTAVSAKQGVPARVAVQIDQEETDALLTLLLHAAEQPRAATEVTDRLLHIFAEAQRALNRAENNA